MGVRPDEISRTQETVNKINTSSFLYVSDISCIRFSRQNLFVLRSSPIRFVKHLSYADTTYLRTGLAGTQVSVGIPRRKDSAFSCRWKADVRLFHEITLFIEHTPPNIYPSQIVRLPWFVSRVQIPAPAGRTADTMGAVKTVLPLFYYSRGGASYDKI